MIIMLELTEDEQSELSMAIYIRIARCREMAALWNRLLPGRGADAINLKEIAVLECVANKMTKARFANLKAGSQGGQS
jgi:hypothetical protein